MGAVKGAGRRKHRQNVVATCKDELVVECLDDLTGATEAEVAESLGKRGVIAGAERTSNLLGREPVGFLRVPAAYAVFLPCVK